MRKAKKAAYPLTRHQSVHILREEAQSAGIRSTTIGNYVDAIICGDAESTLRARRHAPATPRVRLTTSSGIMARGCKLETKLRRKLMCKGWRAFSENVSACWRRKARCG